MPTLDALPPATAVADSDALLVSQGGVTRQATRAQVVAGLQPALSVPAQSLLGRSNDGGGAPEAIAVGANLALVGGTLSAAAAPFVISGLPQGLAPAPADLVPLSQGTQNARLSYAQFMAGVASVPGLDASAMTVAPSVGGVSRRLADLLADAVAVESFGAVGDGVTDDTAALAAAVASGRPVRLGARTYAVAGPFSITTPGVTLLGVPGATVLRRSGEVGEGGWIAVLADRFVADGVIFDANGAAVTQDGGGVLIGRQCQQSYLTRCVFRAAAGATQGCGLTFQASDPVVCQHVVRDCEAAGNTLHGIWVQACRGVAIRDCRLHDNTGDGVHVDFADPTFAQKARLVQVLGNRAWANQRGISVGAFTTAGTQAPPWGHANPDVMSVLVAGNTCHGNSGDGIAASGQWLAIVDNSLTDNATTSGSGAGLRANVAYARVGGNVVSGTSPFGIHCGGSIYSDVSGNLVSGPGVGVGCGGSVVLRVAGNTIWNCGSWGILANNVETDGNGASLGIACSGLIVASNLIGIATSTAGGVWLRDAPQNAQVADNVFVGTGGAVVGNCLWAATDSVTVSGNRWSAAPTFTANPVAAGTSQQLVYPDIADVVTVSAAPSGIQAMVSAFQARLAGQVGFVRVTAGGSGYSRATVAITGPGQGAAATAVLSGGAVIGIVVTAGGSGYGAIGATLTVAISGDGSGAQAVGYVAVPVVNGRRLVVRCATPVLFSRNGSVPLQDNWTGADLHVPAGTEVEWLGGGGSWQAMRFVSADQIGADGLGGTILRSGPGADVILRPQGGGHIRLTSDAAPAGCVSAVGHGSPAGVVAAPPGSDYRNLDGGAGGTLWIKRSGTDASGWAAVA